MRPVYTRSPGLRLVLAGLRLGLRPGLPLLSHHVVAVRESEIHSARVQLARAL